MGERWQVDEVVEILNRRAPKKIGKSSSKGTEILQSCLLTEGRAQMDKNNTHRVSWKEDLFTVRKYSRNAYGS